MISIIIPVYNKKSYIDKVLNDIIKQTFTDYECLLIDDGSTDGSGEICDSFANIDNRFKVFHTKNSGVSHARNIGLDNASGEYITFIDADDHIESDYLEQLYNDITKSMTDLVICGMKKYWEDSFDTVNTVITYSGSYKMKSLMSDFATVQKSTGIYGFCCGKMLRRELIGETRFSEWLHLAEDFEFYLRIYPRVKTVFFDDKCKYHYLQEAKNSSNSKSSENIDFFAQLKLNLYYREFLKEMGAYSDQNRDIIENLLSDYSFFTVFHSPRSVVIERLHDVHKFVIDEHIDLNGNGLIKKTIMCFIRNDMGLAASMFLRTYDSLRKIKGRR